MRSEAGGHWLHASHIPTVCRADVTQGVTDVASPRGADSNRLLGWLRDMDELRRALGNVT